MAKENPDEPASGDLLEEVLTRFPADFLRLGVPEQARRLDLNALELAPAEELDRLKEGVEGSRALRPTLVAEAPDWDSGLPVTFHVQLEARYLKSRAPLLLATNRLLALRLGRPVDTIAVYVRGGPAGPRRRVFRERSLGRTTTSFHYDSFGLSQAMAEDYLAQPVPLGWALAAWMHPGGLMRRPLLRLACIRRIREALTLSETSRRNLADCLLAGVEAAVNRS